MSCMFGVLGWSVHRTLIGVAASAAGPAASGRGGSAHRGESRSGRRGSRCWGGCCRGGRSDSDQEAADRVVTGAPLNTRRAMRSGLPYAPPRAHPIPQGLSWDRSHEQAHESPLAHQPVIWGFSPHRTRSRTRFGIVLIVSAACAPLRDSNQVPQPNSERTPSWLRLGSPRWGARRR